MEFLELLKAILIGIVQGITEWLPVSSTGHMILFDELFPLNMSEDFKDFFLVAIQLGSILAVCVLYFHKLNPLSRKKSKAERDATWRLWGNVLIGCLPAGILGVLLDDWIDARFYSETARFPVVGTTLLLYGIAFIAVERLRRGKAPRLGDVHAFTWRDALLVGGFQVLSLIPGTSRSGSTILGASLLGIGRSAAAEFSFFMALPVMAGATLLKGLKFLLSGVGVTGAEIGILIAGVLVAFLVSLVAIRFLMDFVRRHSFEAFGWYRIALGGVVLLYWCLAK
ncbi:MAG: undecaprenyl-diphosphate phosphatase [Clostridia bacterium]|nr:undecaprenyl-diphosphate phosphatase [Clostridia bacterium]